MPRWRGGGAQIEASVARYLQQLDTADRQEPSAALATKITGLREKIAKLGDAMRRLADIEARMLESPDQQVSLTDPDARSMATSGRGSGVVGYNVQVAVEAAHHLIVAHEVTNVGSDRSQLAPMAKAAKAAFRAASLDVGADRGYFNSEEILSPRRPRPQQNRTGALPGREAAQLGKLTANGRSTEIVTPSTLPPERFHTTKSISDRYQ
jgi:hypothetical protein